MCFFFFVPYIIIIFANWKRLFVCGADFFFLQRNKAKQNNETKKKYGKNDCKPVCAPP